MNRERFQGSSSAEVPEDSISVQKSFAEQFEMNRHQLDFLGDTLEVVDVKPENPRSEVPVVVIPGYTETVESYRDSVEEVYKRDYRTLCYSHPRRGGTPEKIEGIETAELRKSGALDRTIEELKKEGIEQVSAIAHSEASINTIIEAFLHPEKIRSLVLMHPAGMVGKMNFFKLALRAQLKNMDMAKRMKQFEPTPQARLKRGGDEAMKYIFANIPRALIEGIAISKTDIYEMLKIVHSKGVRISIIASTDDVLFPMEEVQAMAKKNELGAFIDGFYSVKGAHDQIVSHPEQYMGAAVEALEALEKKRETPAIAHTAAG